jgi:hypothetical protein
MKNTRSRILFFSLAFAQVAAQEKIPFEGIDHIITEIGVGYRFAYNS